VSVQIGYIISKMGADNIKHMANSIWNYLQVWFYENDD